MSFIRTILGDLPTNPGSGGLGMCDAHEHLAIAEGYVTQFNQDFLLDDPSAIVKDLGEFKAHGGGWVVDTMPTGPGRHAAALAEISRRSGVAVVCPTGLHLAQYYPEDHPLLSMNRDGLAAVFIEEIESHLTDEPGQTPSDLKPIDGSPYRCGVVKVAGGRDYLDDLQREAFAAAGAASAKTGCPIITHCEAGTAGVEQIECLIAAGADPRHVVLSHCDRQPDAGYHREMLQAGVCLEYDNHFRDLKRRGDCPTADLILTLAPDFPEQIVVGMDLARRSYWPSLGGSPGPVWLVRQWRNLLRDRGVTDQALDRILIHNPVDRFSFRPVGS